jgi:hypothetical protein
VRSEPRKIRRGSELFEHAPCRIELELGAIIVANSPARRSNLHAHARG